MTYDKSVTTEKFLELSKNNLPIIVDIRDKEAFDIQHIPNAINIPLFNADQKEIINILNNSFQRYSLSILHKIDEFIKFNTDIYVSELKNVVSQKEASAKKSGRSLSDSDKTIVVYCWWGGPYSQGLANILKEYGFRVLVLNKGYHDYVKFLNRYLHKIYSFKVIGGKIGSGKTAILYELGKAGEQILDLEKCARHSGTVFGALGKPNQRRNRNYMVSVGLELSLLNLNRPIWIEEKTRNLGKYRLQSRTGWIDRDDWTSGYATHIRFLRFSQDSFWEKITAAPIYRIELPIELRIKRIVTEYSQFTIDELKEKATKLLRKLGNERYALAIKYLESGNLNESVRIILQYYDSYYNRTIHERNLGKEVRIEVQEGSPEMTAKRLINEAYKDES